ncbi:MAG: PEP/pyruvate-binding domain-containing protein [Pseudomonadota bacterium]
MDLNKLYQVAINDLDNALPVIEAVDKPITLIGAWVPVLEQVSNFLYRLGYDVNYLDIEALSVIEESFLQEAVSHITDASDFDSSTDFTMDARSVHRLMRSKPDHIRFIDVRWPVDYYERGYLFGSENISDVAFLLNPSVIKQWEKTRDGEQVIVLSYYPERSELIARWLRAQGHNAVSLDGGYQRLDELGLFWMPNYPNRDWIWGRDSLFELVNLAEDIIFIDTRPVPDILRDPIRLPRVMPVSFDGKTWEEALAIASKFDPTKRYMGLAYDQETTYQSMLIGYAISQTGGVWLGLNSIPHSYSAEDYRVALEINPKLHDTYALKRAPYDAMSVFYNSLSIDAVIFIALFAFILRAMMLPLQLLGRVGERDITSNNISGGYALSNRYSRPWLKITANILVIIFLIISSLAFSTWLSQYSSVQGYSGLWIDSLLMPDTYLIIPILTGVILFIQLLAIYTISLRVIIFSALASILIVLVMASLSAAMATYVFSLTAMGLIIHLCIEQYERYVSRRDQQHDGLPPFPVSLLEAHKWRGISPKAAFLSAYGHRFGARFVPKGLVIPFTLLRYPHMLKADERLVEDTCDQVRLALQVFSIGSEDKVIVRSCAASEDETGAGAGRYISVVCQSTKSELVEAVTAVLNHTLDVSADHIDSEEHALIIQRYVSSQTAGVAVSHNPACPLVALIEAGSPEAVTSGDTVTEQITVDRRDWKPNDHKTEHKTQAQGPGNPAIWQQVAQLLRRSELLIGGPVDIEWAVQNGRVSLLQIRPQHDLAAGDPIAHERWRVANITTWKTAASDSWADILPTPSILSASLYERAYGGSVMVAFGRLWHNAQRPWFKTVALKNLTPVNLQEELTDFYHQLARDLRLWQAIDSVNLDVTERQHLMSKLIARFVETDLPFSLAITRWAQRSKSLPDSLTWPEAQAAARMASVMTQEQPAEYHADLIGHGFSHRADIDLELARERFVDHEDIWPKASLSEVDAHIDIELTAEILKDDIHHYVVRDVALLRRWALAHGRALGIDEYVFDLTIDELTGQQAMPSLSDLKDRHDRWTMVQAVKLPGTLVRKQLLDPDYELPAGNDGASDNPGHTLQSCHGTVVSSFLTTIEAPVLVIDHPDMLTSDLAVDGKILVLRQGFVTAAQYFNQAKAIVLPHGGQLSHLAIVARSAKMPAIFSAGPDIMTVENGTTIRLEPDGGIHISP